MLLFSLRKVLLMDILLAIAVLPVYLICYYVYKKDTSKEPIKLLFKLLFLGVLSCFPAIFLEIFLGSFFPSEGNMNIITLFLYYLIVIAFVEEICKFIFTYLGSYNHREFTNLYDMMVYSTFVSLGFALFENILYVCFNSLQEGVVVGILRALFAVPGHACFGLMMGYYLGLSKVAQHNNNQELLKKNMALSLFVPMMMHTFYDFSLALGNIYLLGILLIYIIFIYIFLIKKIKYISSTVKDFKISINYCNQCGKKFNINGCCTNCSAIEKDEIGIITNSNLDNDSQNNKRNKTFFGNFIFSSIIFLLIIIANIICIYKYNRVGSTGWFYIFLCIFFTGIPLLMLIIFSIMNLRSVTKLKKRGIIISKKMKIMNIINVLFIPFIFVFCFFGWNTKEIRHKLLIKQKLDEIYGSSYKILNTCSFSLFSTGDYYLEALIDLNNFEYPVIAHLDLYDMVYSDNYNNLLRMKQLNYQSYINSLFNDKTIALMSIKEDYEFSYVRKSVDLNIIMNKKNLNNKYLLRYNLRQLLNKYMSEFPDYYFDLKIYFTDEIDNSNINEYYYLLIPESFCDNNLDTEVDKSELLLMSIGLRNNDNVDFEIEDSLKRISKFSNED